MIKELITEKEKVEEKETKDLKEVEIPKGFYVGEVVTGTANVIALDGKTVNEQELLVALAKHSQEQTGFKFE